MDIAETYHYLPKESNPFAKYGLEITEDNLVLGPVRPALYSHTPIFSLESRRNCDLTNTQTFLEKCFNGKFSIEEDRQQLISLLDNIFIAVTNRLLNEYVQFIFMNKEDFHNFRLKVRGNVDQGKLYDAINLGGLVVVGAEMGDDRILPLLFHEIGHSLYPPENDNFIDELRAYYFQIICTKLFENQLQMIGMPMSYSEHEDSMFPSEIHKQAYKSARALYGYNMMQEKEYDDSPYSRRMRNLQFLVKQQ